MANKRDEKVPLSVTQLDIARACGLNQATVSRVLTGYPHIAEETKRQVFDAAQQLGYNPDRHDAARRLVLKRQGRTLLNHTLGITLSAPLLRYRYFTLIMQGAWQAAREAGYSILILQQPSSAAAHESAPSPVSRGEIDGVLIIDLSAESAGMLCGGHAECLIPCLLLLQTSTPFPCPVLTVDYRLGGYLSAQHLLALGHRHLLHYGVAPVDDSPVCRRLHGAQQALREWGMDPECHLTIRQPAAGWDTPDMLAALAGWTETPDLSASFDPAARELVALLREHPEITAIVAINDAQAILIAYALRAAGYRVPEDISVVGFDDTDPLPDDRGYNTLTSVRLPLQETGYLAARWMIGHVEQGRDPGQLPTLPVELVARGTTAHCRR